MDEKKTKELLHILKSTDDIADLKTYLSDPDKVPERSFSDYYFSLPQVKAMRSKELILKSGIERTYFYQIRNGLRNPGRDKILLLDLAASLSLDQVQRTLEIGGYGILYAKNRRDAILIFGITNQLTLSDIQELLEKFQEPILL